MEAKKELFEAAKDLLSAKLHVRKILPDPKVFRSQILKFSDPTRTFSAPSYM